MQVRPFLRYQGNKFKLLPFLKEHIKVSNKLWLEPFVGTCSVLTNIGANKAVVADINPDLISCINQCFLQDSKILTNVLKWLEKAAHQLSLEGQEFYYRIRTEFNQNHTCEKFLFLNATCFNGICRYNSKGEFNAPFNKDQHKLKKALPDWTKKLSDFAATLKDKPWIFEVSDFRDFLPKYCSDNIICYLDPPYFDKNCGYFSNWTKQDTIDLLELVKTLPGEFWLSSSLDNLKDESILDLISFKYQLFSTDYTYVIGGTKNKRHAVKEILIKKV